MKPRPAALVAPAASAPPASPAASSGAAAPVTDSAPHPEPVPVAGPASAPALYACEVAHTRTGPVRYRLGMRTYLWFVDLDALPRLPRVLRPLARFDPRDHFGGGAPTLRAGLDAFLAAHGVTGADGRVLMLGHARVLGYVFNPITLYWCHDREGRPVCVVAEVHNTYGDRHCYLLRPGPDGTADTPKELYVSPYFGTDGAYRMRLPLPGERLDLTVQLRHGDGTRPLTATVRGVRRPAGPRALLAAALRHPWSTLAVSAAIRWHGVRLRLKGLPVRPRPTARPTQEGML